MPDQRTVENGKGEDLPDPEDTKEDETPDAKDGRGPRSGEGEREEEDVPDEEDPMEDLKKRISDLTLERDELDETLAYMKAEYENLRRRTVRDVDAKVHRLKEALFLKLLDVVDNLDRALSNCSGKGGDLENFAKGVEMIGCQLGQVLTEYGLRPMETEGEPFDPFKHEAVEKMVNPERPDGVIVEEVQKGYMLDNKVIRPSKVKVNVHPEERASGSRDVEEGQDEDDEKGSVEDLEKNGSEE